MNLTATPYRADDKEITGKLVYRYSFKRAMLKGYIKRLQAVYVAPSELTFTYEGDCNRNCNPTGWNGLAREGITRHAGSRNSAENGTFQDQTKSDGTARIGF